MRKTTWQDRDRVVDIIAESFEGNPSVNWVIKNDKKRLKRIKVLAKYAFSTVQRRGGVYLSSDEQGVILFYKENDYKEGFADYIDQAKLAFGAVGLNRVGSILYRESYKKKIRPRNGEFIYCWFYGVKNDAKGKGAAVELKNYIFSEADRLQLPIYLETSMQKNLIAYKRYGFETFHEWNVEKQNITLWFMKREPK